MIGNAKTSRWAPEPEGPSPIMEGAEASSTAAAALVVAFVALLAVPVVLQLAARRGPSVRAKVAADYRRFGLQKTLNRVETHLVSDSAVAKRVRPPYQAVMLRVAGQGSDRVLVGKDGFLFLDHDYAFSTRSGPVGTEPSGGGDVPDEARPDAFEEFLRKLLPLGDPVAHRAVTRQTDPINWMAGFRDKLARRGIRLLIVIVPPKTAIYPDKLWRWYRSEEGPAVAEGYPDWRRRLKEHGVDLLDLTGPFWDARYDSGGPLFLEQDVHWSPRGVALAADQIAARVRGYLDGAGHTDFELHPIRVHGLHDLTTLLELTPAQAGLPDMSYTVWQVRQGGKPIVRAGNDARVLLFGDSMTYYYDQDQLLEHGVRAGLAAQLTQRLGTKVQTFSRGAGAAVMIKDVLAAHPGLLNDRRVVIWQFVMRSLDGTHEYPVMNVPGG
jgi:hypothetical protein